MSQSRRGRTRNSLILFSPELRKRITIIAVAPGAYISRYLCESVTHLVSKRDVVPLLDPLGMLRCRDTIQFLTPHSIAGWVDHNFNSETYVNELEALYKRFNELHQ